MIDAVASVLVPAHVARAKDAVERVLANSTGFTCRSVRVWSFASLALRALLLGGADRARRTLLASRAILFGLGTRITFRTRCALTINDTRGITWQAIDPELGVSCSSASHTAAVVGAGRLASRARQACLVAIVDYIRVRTVLALPISRERRAVAELAVVMACGWLLPRGTCFACGSARVHSCAKLAQRVLASSSEAPSGRVCRRH